MMRHFKFLVQALTIASSCIVLSSCGAPYVARFEVLGGKVVLVMEKTGILYQHKPTSVCVVRLVINEVSPTFEDTWILKAKDNRCQPVSRLIVGQVGPGFVELVRFKGIKPGAGYRATVETSSFHFGSGEWRAPSN